MRVVDLEQFKRLCCSCGLKITNQRFHIFKALSAQTTHPTADGLFNQLNEQVAGLSRDTVYRSLNAMVECGMIRKLSMPGGATHFDGDITPHHHFLCESCGCIYDFLWPTIDELTIPTIVTNIGQPKLVSVVVTGKCRKCEPFDAHINITN